MKHRTMTMTAVITSDRTSTSADTGMRRSAAPIRDCAFDVTDS
jgi:hypothetical protein